MNNLKGGKGYFEFMGGQKVGLEIWTTSKGEDLEIALDGNSTIGDDELVQLGAVFKSLEMVIRKKLDHHRAKNRIKPKVKLMDPAIDAFQAVGRVIEVLEKESGREVAIDFMKQCMTTEDMCGIARVISEFVEVY